MHSAVVSSMSDMWPAGFGRRGFDASLESSCFLWEDWWHGGVVGATVLGLSDGGEEGFSAKRRVEDSSNFGARMVSILFYG